MTRIKICGITTIEDGLAAVRCGADALGFVFAESRRQVTPERVWEIVRRLPPFVATVGVFVDEPAEWVEKIARECRLTALQFHGHESPDYCRGFDRAVIKAFGVKDGSVHEEMARYRVDACLLDSWRGGGTGRSFDWEMIGNAGERIILAGGLTPKNVVEAIRMIRPYAVDVSSGVEASPGVKDHTKMEAFVRHVRHCER